MANPKPPATPDEGAAKKTIEPSIKPPEKLALNPLQRGLIFTVQLYQWAISPFLGNNCRFYPSCSHYCIEAMESHGVFKGLYLGIRRVLRCHPYCQGGYDPVPEKHHTQDKNKE